MSIVRPVHASSHGLVVRFAENPASRTTIGNNADPQAIQV
jgi:hypothetical protein